MPAHQARHKARYQPVWLGLIPRASEIAAGRRRWLFTGVIDQVAKLLAASDGQLRIRTVQMRRDGMRRRNSRPGSRRW